MIGRYVPNNKNSASQTNLSITTSNSPYRVHKYDRYMSGYALQLVADIYVSSARKQFNAMLKKGLHSGLWAFFHSLFFFAKKNALEPENPYYWEFDEEKAEENFYLLIQHSRKRERTVFGIYAAILKRMLRSVKVHVAKRSAMLSSIIPPKLFFTYSDEEDSARTASKNGPPLWRYSRTTAES